MKVSLIVPVYNVRDYLRQCLDSVAAQTYPELEVILVNDGSTDESLEILLEYTAKYPHFRCYTIENRGLGGARNYGMEYATGQYVMFLDSDDYLSEHCIEVMVNAARESDSDMVCANCYDVREDGSVLLAYKNQYKNPVTSLEQEPELMFNRNCACFKLFRRELFEGLGFVSRVWYEDLRLIPKLYLRAKKIAYVEDFVYFYLQRAGSIMQNANYRRNLEIIDACEDLLSYYRAQGVYDRYRDALEFLVIDHIAVSALARVAMGKNRESREVRKKMQQYLRTFPKLYANPYRKSLSRNRKIILWCNRHRMYWLTRLLLRAKQLGK